MPEAKFVLKEPKSDDKTLIYLFFNYDSQRFKYSTGERISPKFWNTKKQRAIRTPQFPESPEFNQKLNNIEAAIHNTYRRLENDKVANITPDMLRVELNAELNKKPSVKKLELLEWIEQEIELIKEVKKHTSIQVYNALLKHLKDFSIKRKYKLTFETINLEFYDLFKDYFLNQKGFLTNTFGKQIKTLKALLNIAGNFGQTDHPFSVQTDHPKLMFFCM